MVNNHWLVVLNMAFIFHFIYGMSSFPLTNSYFSRCLKPPTSNSKYYDAVIKPIMKLEFCSPTERYLTPMKSPYLLGELHIFRPSSALGWGPSSYVSFFRKLHQSLVICVSYNWVKYNDLTTTSLEIMVSQGNHPQMGLIQVSEIL